MDIKFTVVSVKFCFKIFRCKTKFHDSRDHFMTIRDTNFKNVVFIKLGLKFLSKREIQHGFFELLKQVGSVFNGESANVAKN